MQIKFYKSDSSQKAIKNREALQVRLPGYVSTSSWAGSTSNNVIDIPAVKGRVVTAPPALHQLGLEAFWLD